MTQTIDATTMALAGATTARPILLFEIYLLSGTQYFTSADIQISWGGNLYASFPLAIGNVRKSASGLIDSVQIQLSNVSRSISALLQAEDFRGKRIVVRVGMWQTDLMAISTPAVFFDGLMDDVQGKEEKDSASISATCTTDLAFWQRPVPGRIYQATCPWVFKGTECGYVGAEVVCNRTWGRCKQLLNTDNYGGFRHLPALQVTEVWWGKSGAFRLPKP